jgi:hypothetical protein
MAFMRKLSLAGFGLLACLGFATGCQTNAGSGALIGGAAGAGLGAVVGHQSHGNTASKIAIAITTIAVTTTATTIPAPDTSMNTEFGAITDRMARDTTSFANIDN